MSDPEGIAARAFMNPPSMALGVNHAAWRTAEIPGANGHATARALARVYGALARGGEQDGVHAARRRGHRALPRGAVARPRPGAADRDALRPRLHAVAGPPDARFGPSPRAFGHPGAGGSVGFADPDARVGFGYVMNRMGPHILLDPRADRADRRGVRVAALSERPHGLGAAAGCAVRP